MGAGPGIGAKVSPRLAARGTRMALLDLDATAVCAETSECPGAVALVADVTDAVALEAAVIEAVARLDQTRCE